MVKTTRKVAKNIIRDLAKEDTSIAQALIASKKPIGRLGQGVHNNQFYYGASLIWEGKPISAIITREKVYLGLNYIYWRCKSCQYYEEQIKPSWEKIRPPKSCDCLKISSRDWEVEEMINPIKDEFGLNYRTEFNEDALDYLWQTEDIKDYVNNGKGKFLNKEYAQKTLKELYETIVEINKKYIDHLNPSSHKYTACWLLATYCYTLFEQFGRLYNRAERGSGKTKQARILKFLSFNPMWITKGTESSQFRDAEATCGTFIVDNMDKLHEDLKKSIEHYIETAWMREATYRLTNKETMRTEKFQAYTPMALNNIYGLDENTIDKTFEIPMLKSVNDKIQRLKVTSKSERWEEIRNSLRGWMLDNWDYIEAQYRDMHGDFSGRAFDVAEGALTIAKFLGDDLFKELEQYCIEKLEEEMVELENNSAYMVFSEIWEQFHKNPLLQENNVFLSDISEILFPRFNPNLERGTKEYNDKKRNFSRYIGKIIRSVPMFRKGGMSKGRTYIKFPRKELHQYMKLQHFINEDGSLPTSTSSTYSTSSTCSTQGVEQGEQVEQVEQDNRVEQSDELDIEIVKIGERR